ncbi:hypothetical protein BGZ73_000740 [Actinomortierella ambigua]|nr:hypothetical protein BGZ73_000740 [Actinomortierella ambigua]
MSSTLGLRHLTRQTRPWQKSASTQQKATALFQRSGHTSSFAPLPSVTLLSQLPWFKRNPCATQFASLPSRALFSTSRSTLSKPSNSTQKGEETPSRRPDTRPCWKCAQPNPFLAMQCPQCKAVQPVAPGANYFETLGLPPEPNYDIDVKDLRNKFFKIQQLIHPDSYSQNINGDQAHAQQQSTFTNKAYACLKEPLPRANYILELKGAGVREAESLENPELLMEVMEARELLEEAETEAEVDQLKCQNEARIQETTKGLSKAFKEDDLATAKKLVIQLQYWIRIQNVIREWAAGKPIVADHV